MDSLIEHTDRAARGAAIRRDPRGLAISAGADSAILAVEQAIESMLSYFGDPLQALDQAIAADPGWVHPHTLKAAVLLTLAEYEPACEARECLDRAEGLARGANERERAHLVAARTVAQGDWERGCELWDAILVRWPLDSAALLFAHLFDFYRGDALNLRRRPQRVLPHWSRGLPLYGYVLGMQAFGLEESGQYGEAEETGRAALEVNRRDPWAVHAVAHVHEMQGRHAEGARWLGTRQADWAVDNGFAYHNWFHAALFQLENMDLAAALDTYDAHLADATDMALQRVDGTAVLWRLQLLGVDVDVRFERLAGYWRTEAPDAGFYAFNDLHALVAGIGAGSSPASAAGRERLLAALAEPSSAGASNQAMSAQVGLPLARAWLDYARGDWPSAAEGLFRVRDRAHAFGGSHAQRDILTQTLLDAAIRAGDRALATHVLNERCPAKASTPLTAYWRERIGALAAAQPGQ
ncbi:tetratricopeptide repeat protein [Ramlibacter tataouinensis]|uniref:tetratricopeptide repeat protein n=1 Tax=Ramlibacter tataouinensis TaxID=94132 RepID=UPI0022F4036E|nr:tetratricopeptide repeat protein [Ramlibacter tataouinensis]WBY03697.1 tetratricopeptide repeat protein [Ramlibacter tataouinensis]